VSKISIGKAPDGSTVYADLDVLSRTRALIQASSGGGKSFLIRRLAEQIFGKIPEFIVDEEGEFPSLRCEKFPFVLVGKGGDTPADPRSAQILAHRLLEHRASAIFDLSELKPQVRHHWVRLFFEALVESPRALWTPVIVFLDEAHHYAPEKGDSEARGAVVDAATRGRKRGICLIPATQRLAKLSKDVSGELLNRLIGPTFEDLDIERAADLLSIVKAEKADFAKSMRVLAPGNFQLLGRAFGTERIQVKVGPVETTPPELGRSKRMLAPPPPPEKIKAFLPKLQDLPKEAEEKAKTEAELRAEIRSLKTQLAVKPTGSVIAKPTEKAATLRIEVPVVKPAELLRVEKAMGRAVEAANRAQEAAGHLRGFSDLIQERIASVDKKQRQTDASRIRAAVTEVRVPRVPLKTPLERPQTVKKPANIIHAEKAPQDGQGTTPAQGRILNALSDFYSIGRSEVPRTWVAARAGASHRSGGFKNNLGRLRALGLIDYGGAGTVHLTEAGLDAAPPPDRPSTTEAMLQSCVKVLSPAQERILRAVFDAFPGVLVREDLAAAVGASSTSGGFKNNLGALRSAGMIEYQQGGVKCANWIFVEERATA